MDRHSIYSGMRYLYDYFFLDFRKKLRWRGLQNWLLELIYEIGHLIRYPKFKYLFKIYPEHLNIDAEEQLCSIQYETVNSYTLDKCFKTLQKFLNAYNRSVFVDVGSGAGRILHGAYLSGFNRLVGIELSEELCRLCAENLDVHLPKNIDRKIVNLNIKDIEFGGILAEVNGGIKAESVVFFLNNPFKEEVVQVFMNKLDALQSYDLYIVYVWKQYEDCVTSKGFEIVHEERINNRFTWDSFRVYRKLHAWD